MRRGLPDNGGIAFRNDPPVSSIRPLLVFALSLCLLSSAHAIGGAGQDASPASSTWRILTGDDVIDDGLEGTTGYAILADSVQRRGDALAFDVQSTTPGTSWAGRQRVLADCSRKVRGLQPADAASGARVPVTRPRAGTREARELALACTLPEGPRARWFAGVVVTADGVVVAPHARTQGCGEISTGIGAARRKLDVIADEDDITLLRIHGPGTWPVMPAARLPLSGGRHPVTLLGVFGTDPRASAAMAVDAGSNGDDPGWPQVLTLSRRALTEGVVWDDTGTVVGIALAIGVSVDHHGQSFVRMLPASEVRQRLVRHQVDWPTSPGRDVDAAGAMRRALSSTLPLICTR